MNFSYLHLSVVFALMFGPKFGAFIDCINALSLILIFVLIRQRLPKEIYSLLFVLAIYILHVTVVVFYSGVNDTWHLLQPWRFALNMLAIALYVSYLQEIGYTFKALTSYIEFAIFIHALILILMFVNTDFRYYWYDLTGFVEKSYLRTAGFTHSYGNTAILMCMPFFTFFTTENVFAKPLTRTCMLITVFVGLMLTGRAGLYLVPFLMLAAIMVNMFYRRLGAKDLIAPAVIVLFASLLYVVSVARPTIVSDSVFLLQASVFVNETVRHAFEVVFTYLDKGIISIESLETIKNFYFHNDSLSEYIFGTGHYGRGESKYLETDISYAHFFSMVGVIGMVWLLYPFLYSLICTFRRNLHHEYFVLFFYTMILLIMNYKQATLMTRGLASLWLLYFFGYLLLNLGVHRDSTCNNPKAKRSLTTSQGFHAARSSLKAI